MPSSTHMAYDTPSVQPLPYLRVCDVEPPPPGTSWLIEEIWPSNGVGILGGQAKVCKTYLAAELSLAVATGRPALGRFATPLSGPVLFYGAEDSLAALRTRFEGIAVARNCDLERLAVHLIDVPVLRLDTTQDLQRLRAAISRCQPRLLVLDPFVRLVGNVDENSSQDVSAVLGSLRAIQRDLEVAVLLVHHARKSPAAHPYHAYRGSSDFAAWSDSNLFLAKKDRRLTLSIEHRSAPSPEPIQLKLKQEPAPHLAVAEGEPACSATAEANPLRAAIIRELQTSPRPATTVELRERLHRRKSDVVDTLEQLAVDGTVTRTAKGWLLT